MLLPPICSRNDVTNCAACVSWSLRVLFSFIYELSLNSKLISLIGKQTSLSRQSKSERFHYVSGCWGYRCLTMVRNIVFDN